VYTEGEGVAGGVDLVTQRQYVLGLEANHVQYRAENFLLQVGDAVDADHGGCDKEACVRQLLL
jgi:hypothetical protein